MSHRDLRNTLGLAMECVVLGRRHSSKTNSTMKDQLVQGPGQGAPIFT